MVRKFFTNRYELMFAERDTITTHENMTAAGGA